MSQHLNVGCQEAFACCLALTNPRLAVFLLCRLAPVPSLSLCLAGIILEKERRGSLAAIRSLIHHSQTRWAFKQPQAGSGTRGRHHGGSWGVWSTPKEDTWKHPAQPGILCTPVTKFHLWRTCDRIHKRACQRSDLICWEVLGSRSIGLLCWTWQNHCVRCSAVRIAVGLSGCGHLCGVIAGASSRESSCGGQYRSKRLSKVHKGPLCIFVLSEYLLPSWECKKPNCRLRQRCMLC